MTAFGVVQSGTFRPSNGPFEPGVASALSGIYVVRRAQHSMDRVPWAEPGGSREEHDGTAEHTKRRSVEATRPSAQIRVLQATADACRSRASDLETNLVFTIRGS